jgi:hypothetical protein
MMGLALQTSLFCFIAKLQGDKKAFQGAKQAAADNHSHGHEDDEMNPIGRFIGEFGPERRAEHQKPADQADEDSGAIAGIRESKVEPAAIAFFAKIDETREEFAAPAARTKPKQTGFER